MPAFALEACIAPTEQEVASAREASRRLVAHLGAHTRLTLQIVADDTPQEVLVVPRAALQLFASLLAEMAQGHAVTLLPLYAELTTQEAADLLHVSRPHVVRLMEQGYLPFHKIGTHRRVRLRDVLAYQQRQRAEREHALDALVAQAQELDMGY